MRACVTPVYDCFGYLSLSDTDRTRRLNKQVWRKQRWLLQFVCNISTCQFLLANAVDQ